MLQPQPISATAFWFMLITCFVATCVPGNVNGQKPNAWNQGAGPDGSFVVGGAAPTAWSVVRDQNIRWRKPLPETGQSTVVTWGDRVFFTTMRHEESDEPRTLGSDIVAWCCNADDGSTIWKRDMPAKFPLRLSGCFSDSSSPPPVTDGKRVCFFNASGSIACFDLQGNKIWQNEMMCVGRSQPFIVGDNVVFTKQSYMPDDQGHFTHEHKNLPVDGWTQLQALDIATGKPMWNTTCGINMGSVSLPLTMSDGREVIVCGRGGGHSPPEKPEGISLVDANNGETLWTLPLTKFMSTMTFNAFDDQILVFHRDEHLWVNARSGKIDRRVSITGDVTVAVVEGQDRSYASRTVQLKSAKKSRMIIQQSNVLVGQYHYFRSYTQPWLGRVNVDSGVVEYLQLPLQLKRVAGDKNDYFAWDESDMDADAIEAVKASQRKRPKKLPLQYTGFALNTCKNGAGQIVMGDARSQGNGWSHHASQVPTAVGEYLYVCSMSGTVYVISHAAEQLDGDAVVAINDLGPIGESWTRASLSFADGRLYAHTIKELVCIQD